MSMKNKLTEFSDEELIAEIERRDKLAATEFVHRMTALLVGLRTGLELYSRLCRERSTAKNKEMK